MIRTYEAAHARLMADYEAAVLDPSRTRQASRLRALLRANEQIVDGLIEASRTWIAATLPELHAAGAAAAAQVIGTQFAWTAPHVEAVNELAARTWDDVASKLQDLRTDTRTALRAQVRDATRSALLENRTATQAGRELAKEAARQGIGSVTYSNGARHTIADYADSVIRTTTAEAYNIGSIVQSKADGFPFVEIFDGPTCCLGPGHNNGPLANGLVMHVDDVEILGHPRCRRSLSPRVDVMSPEQADGADPTQGVDAVTQRSRGPEPATIPARTPREPRGARTPRTARAAS